MEDASPPVEPADTAAGGAPLAQRLADTLDRPLVLVGMMGSGKTAVGRRLAALLGWAFTDADEEIETAAQLTIPEIFAQFGEPYFRDGERRVIARLMAAGGQDRRKVIATGGGAFCNPATRALILEAGLAVWLDASLDTLVARTARRNNRPLLRGGDARATLARLAAERREFYACAPVRITTGNGPIGQTVDQALAAIGDWLDGRDARDARKDLPQ